MEQIILKLHQILSESSERMRSAYVRSFGCQLNMADGEHISGLLSSLGYVLVDTPEEAGLIILNTCAVRESAEERIFGILGNYKHLKYNAPETIIGLCGCMANEEKTISKLRTHYPFVDLLFGTSSIRQLPALLLEHYQGNRFAYDTGEYDALYGSVAPARSHPFKASVPIMFGCNNFCTYCIVPYVRGRERSRLPEEIIAEVKALIRSGYKEIMLLGQNVNSYGKDLPRPMRFSELLREIDRLEGEFVIRFMSSHPKDANDDLFDQLIHGRHIGRHLHLPVQSGSDRILQAMNRRYTVADYLRKIEMLRRQMPDFSITSDIIVGFPDETEADFQQTLHLIEQVGYDNLFTFIYSKRSGTRAAEYPDCTSAEEKKERMNRLLTLQRQITDTRYRRFIGRTLTVLVDGLSKRQGYLTGKDLSYIIVEFPGDAALIGQFVQVRITKSHNWAVEGILTEAVQ